MGKKVFEVAKELGMPHQELFPWCDRLGIAVKNYMSALSDADEARLKAAVGMARKPPAAEAQKGPIVARRRPGPGAGGEAGATPGPAVPDAPARPGAAAPSGRTAPAPIPVEGVVERRLGSGWGGDGWAVRLATGEVGQLSDGSLLRGVTLWPGRRVVVVQRMGQPEAPAGAFPALDLIRVDVSFPETANDGGAEPIPAGIQRRGPPLTAERAVERLRDGLEARGLRYSAAWVWRFLAAARAARRVGGLVLIAGSTGTGKSAIVRNAATLIDGAGCGEIAVRPEWLQAADLLGYVDPIRGLFSPSAFVSAVRAAAAAPESDAPWFVLLDEMNLARVESYGADLLSVLELPAGSPGRALVLYPPETNALWLAERKGADPRRLRELDAFFARAPEPETAWRLPLPANLTVVGTLNTDQHTASLSPKVLDRGFVLQSEPLTAASVFDAPPVRETTAAPIALPPPPEDVGPGVWTRFPNARRHFQELLGIWSDFGFPPSRRTVRNAQAYVAYAGRPDDAGPKGANELAADLLHLFLIPRVVLAPDRAVALADRLLRWLGERLAPDHAVRREVEDLRARAEGGQYGDVRGLR